MSSTPTVASSMPANRAMSDLTVESLDSASTLVRPSRTIAKYSADPNFSASDAKSCEKKTSASQPTSPPNSAASAAQPSASAARPRRAIRCPSRVRGTSFGSPGMLSRIAVSAPP
jgi:hypothetical protein